MKRFSVLIAALAFVLVFFCACGEKREIYGTWTSTADTAAELVISENGSASLEIDGLRLEGTYVIENNIITLFVTDPNGQQHTISALFELSDEELILTNAQGQSEVFK